MPLRVTLIRRPQRPAAATPADPPSGAAKVRVCLPRRPDAHDHFVPGRAASRPPSLLRTWSPSLRGECSRWCSIAAPPAPATATRPAPTPRLIRRDPRGGIDRRSTLANLQEFLAAVGPEREATALIALLAVGHPAEPASPRLVAAPLSPRRTDHAGTLAHPGQGDRAASDQ